MTGLRSAMVVTGRRRGHLVRVLIGAAAMLLLAARFAGSALVVSKPIERPHVIVSLASHEWERLPAAAALASRYPEALVVLTLPPVVTRHRCHDCANRTIDLIRRGIRADRIHVLPLGESSTRGEAGAVVNFLRDRHLNRIVIVTSAYHTRRALSTFLRAFGNDRTVVGVEPAGVGEFAMPRQWWRRPYDRWYVSYEWAALARDVARQLWEE